MFIVRRIHTAAITAGARIRGSLFDVGTRCRASLRRIHTARPYGYTVSADVFISFKKTKSKKGTDALDIWIEGEKYTMSLQTTIKRLQQFVKH